MKNVIAVTGASSGFGALAVRALATAGHVVYAGMWDTQGRNAPEVARAKQYSANNTVDLRTVELDVVSDESVAEGINRIISENAGLTLSSTMPATWCLARRRRSHPNNSLNFMTSMC